MKYAFFLLALIAAASATADIMNEFEEDSTQETPIEGREQAQELQRENELIATEGEEEAAETKEVPSEEPQAAVATEEPQVAVATEEPQADDIAVRDRVVNINALNSQPVIQLIQLKHSNRKVLSIRRINGGSFKEGKLLERISIGHGRSSKTGRYLAYRPRYRDYHHTKLGAVFLNLDKLFPCANRNRIFCRRFTSEEDGFFKGRAIIEAADSGNNFGMFGRANVYGMTFQGCRYLSGHKGCLPRWFETIIACFLPRCCAGY